jgi:ubiquinone/menaquinone biosynthesis C-methylase UbiE
VSQPTDLKVERVAEQWERWAKANAQGYITAGTYEGAQFYASGLIEVGRVIEILATTKSYNPEHVILDYGCGTGRHALWFSLLFKGVVGVDISATMISGAQETVAQRGIQNVALLCNQGHSLDLPDVSVDLVFSYITLMHNGRWAVNKLLHEFFRVLKPGSLAILQLPLVADDDERKIPADPGRVAKWTYKEFLQASGEAGFTALKLNNDANGYHLLQRPR